MSALCQCFCSFRLTWPYTSPPFWYLCGFPVPAHQSYLGWKFYCVWLPWYFFFFFIQLGQRVLQFGLMDPSRSGLASTTPPFSKLPACLGYRQADVSDFALNSSSKPNLSENLPLTYCISTRPWKEIQERKDPGMTTLAHKYSPSLQLQLLQPSQ